jgi:hypothetical protein
LLPCCCCFSREEQLIYSILAFNGRDYAGTFSGEDSDSIYLIADTDNFLTVRKTLVYFWPITEDLKVDSQALSKVFSGTLELRQKGKGAVTVILSIYTYYNVRGEYEFNWKVATGSEADAAYKKYQDLIAAYYQASEEYQQIQAAYEALLNELTMQVVKLREEGLDFSRLLEQVQNMAAPTPPDYPAYYNVPPVPLQEGFLINLPEGEYSVRFINEDGTVMEGSDRKVITFRKRGEEGIGLEVIPGDKWTRPVESRTPSSTLYLNGDTDLYLLPFFQNEYNDLYYEKLVKNDAKGNPDLMKWVRIQQVPKARIELIRPDRSTEIILENSFYVEQAKGSVLGYTIVPYDPEGAHKDTEPSLKAFHIPISPGDRVMRLKVQDQNGKYPAGGERRIRIVTRSNLSILLLVLVFIPILVLVIVRVKRAGRYIK